MEFILTEFNHIKDKNIFSRRTAFKLCGNLNGYCRVRDEDGEI